MRREIKILFDRTKKEREKKRKEKIDEKVISSRSKSPKESTS